jgi:CRISPR system Cascade subunit CasB
MADEQAAATGGGLGEIVEGWWDALSRDRGARASLRRCGTVVEIQLERSFHELATRLPHQAADDLRLGRLAAVAGILAHVESNEGNGSFAKALAAPKTGDEPRLSDLRFRRLLAIERPDELLTHFRRAVRLAGGSAPVARLATDLVSWGDRTRKRWAADYYGNVLARGK